MLTLSSLKTVMCPKNSGKDVFATFSDNGGWGNIGTACLVSQVSVLYCNLGKLIVGHQACFALTSCCRLGQRGSHL